MLAGHRNARWHSISKSCSSTLALQTSTPGIRNYSHISIVLYVSDTLIVDHESHCKCEVDGGSTGNFMAVDTEAKRRLEAFVSLRGNQRLDYYDGLATRAARWGFRSFQSSLKEGSPTREASETSTFENKEALSGLLKGLGHFPSGASLTVEPLSTVELS